MYFYFAFFIPTEILRNDVIPIIRTEFINGWRAEKNWYWGMETRRLRKKSFRVTREEVKITRVLKFFLLNGAADFFSVDFEISELKMG